MMTSNKTLLIVDDDEEIASLTAEFLQDRGYTVLTANSAEEAHGVLEANEVDLMVLDIMLPGESGLALCQRVRKSSKLPIIIISAITGDTERIVGLELGADDYLEKPFNPRELQARIFAIFRRTEDPNAPKAVPKVKRYEFSGWVLDEATRHLKAPDGVLVHLSSSEFDALLTLVKSPQKPVSRDALGKVLRGAAVESHDRSIDILISRLRKKLAQTEPGKDFISTVRHQGYLFSQPVQQV
ncbi:MULTISPECIES: response regulator [Pseudovibrio]|uniref:response regulator n=1 Tax=Stappiaceae TaxID=2821832 RepID=UPI002367342B|nr:MULTISPECIES: response regulator [Pseudovibrio]MDD7910951.1 response regulator [Pseudovibrio exalbescens]MDX5593329.1 response regulator [Pseudovibrio sp. SPO723]